MKEKGGFFVKAFYTVDFAAIPNGIQFHTSKAGLELTMQLRMILNFFPSCLHNLNVASQE